MVIKIEYMRLWINECFVFYDSSFPLDITPAFRGGTTGSIIDSSRNDYRRGK